MKYIIFGLLLIISFGCQNETPQQTDTPAATETTPTVPQNTAAYTEFTTTANGLEVYNAYVEIDTTNISSGNKYIKDYVSYELYDKTFYLDKNDEIVLVEDVDTLKIEDLGTYHPYLVRINLMPKPANVNNCQHLVIDFKSGFPTTHRAVWIRARADGWQNGAVNANNFKPCTEDSLECKAQGLLQSIITLLFR